MKMLKMTRSTEILSYWKTMKMLLLLIGCLWGEDIGLGKHYPKSDWFLATSVGWIFQVIQYYISCGSFLLSQGPYSSQGQGFQQEREAAISLLHSGGGNLQTSFLVNKVAFNPVVLRNLVLHFHQICKILACLIEEFYGRKIGQWEASWQRNTTRLVVSNSEWARSQCCQ